MYKTGERILAKRDEEDKWEERIFLFWGTLEHETCWCLHKNDEYKWESGNNFDNLPIALHFHKPLSQKYDPAEMIGKKIRGKATGTFFIIIHTTDSLMQTKTDNCTWEDFDKYFEVID